ncbi:hypothetical protein VQ02_32800 [Methylobacterium variabile]|jgi:hypothetical protein|uniref:Uncharacterized protein n=1 Tax=Methylobacterium variabile TaxID=298794 RepID=A0A0J6S1Y1_9HYPH|nr:hypothetical protein [Methylobacterium variabile]KMO27659.1 hypothetical protein VQ02_32800 [Methylobacterium variabile]
MTLQFALLIIVSIAAAVLAAMKWHAFASADLDRLRQQEHWAGQFSRGARVLLNDDRVPKPLLETLARLNRYLLDPEACFLLYNVFTQPRGAAHPFTMAPEEIALHETHPELAHAIAETLFAGLMAITYTDLRWGERARGAMARRYRGEAQVTELAVAAREVVRSDHPMPPGLIAA